MTEVETVERSEAMPSKSADDRLTDELVGRAQAEGLQLTDLRAVAGGRSVAWTDAHVQRCRTLLAQEADAEELYEAALAPAPGDRQFERVRTALEPIAETA
ncbi:hypothetical protein P8A22_01145 [Streptomyces laculatispora]|uniref:Uncharacterized protein n=1 Tax=Streptomyces laculatispora TaxID=887464 RepID=A0ABY9HXS4_9ACTN|nr:hypothetical protein [Streptomyces laculatispora]WLQ38772.1 hypothetical protein P8A22_01145 [Streptomyces laculatispora]